jgi:hypothetical protein
MRDEGPAPNWARPDDCGRSAAISARLGRESSDSAHSRANPGAREVAEKPRDQRRRRNATTSATPTTSARSADEFNGGPRRPSPLCLGFCRSPRPGRPPVWGAQATVKARGEDPSGSTVWPQQHALTPIGQDGRGAKVLRLRRFPEMLGSRQSLAQPREARLIRSRRAAGRDASSRRTLGVSASNSARSAS